MDGAKCETEKRTLLSARMTLQERAKQLNDLARMSETLMDKFNRTEGQIKEGKGELMPKDPVQPDLIGMFDDTASEMQKYINIIGNNLERALSLVD